MRTTRLIESTYPAPPPSKYGPNTVVSFGAARAVTTLNQDRKNCMFLYLVIYLLHLFTQGKPKQLKLVFIGALHTFHIITYMYSVCTI